MKDIIIHFGHNIKQYIDAVGRQQLFAKTSIDEGHLNSYLAGSQPTMIHLAELASLMSLTIDALVRVPLAANRYVIESKLAVIKMLVCDVDGVLTDGGMYYTAAGDEVKKFNTKDGMGLMRLKSNKIVTGFLSSGFDDRIIKKRATQLGIDCVHVGREKKIDILHLWLVELGLTWEQVAYIGDDSNDIECLSRCGISACPCDATKAVVDSVDIVLQSSGGAGCVREFIDIHMGQLLDATTV